MTRDSKSFNAIITSDLRIILLQRITRCRDFRDWITVDEIRGALDAIIDMTE